MRGGSVRTGLMVMSSLIGAVASVNAQSTPAPSTSAELREAVTVDGVFEHIENLAEIADRNGGVRVSGSAGHALSVDYAEDIFLAAGYQTTRQSFEFPGFIINSPSVVQRVSGGASEELAHNIMTYSGSADATAPASVPVGSALGCSASDFGPSNAGTIVLIARGTCGFGQKATHAFNAGVAAAIIYNNGPAPLQAALSTPTSTFSLDIAVVGVSGTLGQELVAQVEEGLVLRVAADTTREPMITSNLLAESIEGDAERVVIVGAHLDSVPVGPGINDNASGVAALLEVAEQMAAVVPRNQIRFALWSAEEFGLLGSSHYVNGLSSAERDRIALYLNFDMVGSPNYVRFILDGDNSAFPVGPGVVAGPPGSGAIERSFREYFESQGLASAEAPFTGGSDYGPFVAAGVGIPSGGLFSGSNGIKTEAQAAIYGGTAGQAYDACYHQACDGLGNVNLRAVDEMSDAIAHGVFTYAFDTSVAPSVSAGALSARRGGLSGPAGAHWHADDLM